MNLNPSNRKPPIDKVYSLENLNNWPYSGTGLAVIGHPVAHSLSPIMHTSALDELRQRCGKFDDWYASNSTFRPNNYRAPLKLFHRAGFKGLNLTVPHKTVALPHIKISQDIVNEAGASNTLVASDEDYQGYNTDAEGLVEGIRHSLGIDVRDYPVLLLGAGGAARSAAVKFLHIGIPHLYLANRSTDRLEDLRKDLEPIESDVPISTHPLPGPVSLKEDRPTLIINATSLGLKPSDPSPLLLDNIPANSFAYDMIYSPAQTTFLKEAAQKSMQCANGLTMLVYQGLRSLTLWTGEQPSAQVMLAAVKDKLKH